MLRISDIPSDYPLRTRAINRHVQQFWSRKPALVETRFGPVAVLRTEIDTTLALHRAGERFRRLKKALRVYAPYEALHLDWYANPCESVDHRSSVSHWGGHEQLRSGASDRWRATGYWDVSWDSSGPRIYRRQVPMSRRSRIGTIAVQSARRPWRAAVAIAARTRFVAGKLQRRSGRSRTT